MDMDMSPPPNEGHMVVIAQLMAEKDRLITEKDELVVSKDRLWREMHQIVQEKNERIEELFMRCTTATLPPHDDFETQVLRDEVRRLGRRNLELEKALRDALEMDDNIEADSLGTSGSSDMLPRNSGDIINMDNIEHYPDEIARPDATSVTGLETLLQLRTPTSPSAPFNDVGRITVASRPPTSIKIQPIIRSDSYITHTYGKLDSIEPALLEMVLRLLENLGPNDKFVSMSRQGYKHCIERRLNSGNASAWTNEQPGCFACRTCFNRRQPCIRAIGNHEFLLLPLPVEARHSHDTWQDGAYYIYQNDGTTLKFPGVWNRLK